MHTSAIQIWTYVQCVCFPLCYNPISTCGEMIRKNVEKKKKNYIHIYTHCTQAFEIAVCRRTVDENLKKTYKICARASAQRNFRKIPV